jgi:hypothetical protein
LGSLAQLDCSSTIRCSRKEGTTGSFTPKGNSHGTRKPDEMFLTPLCFFRNAKTFEGHDERKASATMEFMPCPWLNIPLEDYESHMDARHVAQLGALADLFEETLRRCEPTSVAILGIAGGNGLSRIDPNVTTRIVGVDINPAYLEAVRARFQAQLPLTLHCLDLAADMVPEGPVELVHAALIFEHAGVERCLETAVSLVAPSGYLSTVLQLPSGNAEPDVAPSVYPTMQTLSSDFHLVEPHNLCQRLKLHRFELQHKTQRVLPGGKAFWLGIFSRLP